MPKSRKFAKQFSNSQETPEFAFSVGFEMRNFIRVGDTSIKIRYRQKRAKHLSDLVEQQLQHNVIAIFLAFSSAKNTATVGHIFHT